MAINIGDKVRFLSDVGGGIVRGFQKGNIVLVEDEDGFEIPVPAKECVVIETNDLNIAKPAPPNLHPGVLCSDYPYQRSLPVKLIR